MNFDRKHLSDDQLIRLYHELVRPRIIEEKMLVLLRQGKLAKWFSGIGQEAVSVGAAMALHQDEYVLPMHRNLGIFSVRNIPLHRLFSQWMGKPGGFTNGRDRSFHFGTQEYKIIGMISHLGPQCGIADGIALGNILKQNNKATIVFSGDGGASEGDFHEAVNVAAVWDLPVIFIVENNGYGLSTPSSEQYRCKSFADKGIGYGIQGVSVDGNNILEVYNTLNELLSDIRKNPRPIIFEARTFRMRGHEEASGTKYVPQQLFDEWGKKDPIANYENYLLESKIISTAQVESIRTKIKTEIEEHLKISYAESDPEVNTVIELRDMYAPSYDTNITASVAVTEKRFLDAITDGLRQGMQRHKNLVIMGQDIAEYGGVFKATQGFVEEFGKSRVRNTPITESSILGASLGLSINGYKSIVEMQFADFVTCGFNQIVNNLAKTHYRWGQNADVVVRMPTGAAVGAGPFHSQSTEAWFFHVPGLKILYPAFPSDAKGLLAAAIEDPNPVMFFEHKALYRSVSGLVADDYFTIPIGKASKIREGTDLTIVTYGLGVHWAMEALDENKNIQADLIDLRSLLPWDKETVLESVKRTGKVIIFHEDTLTGGIGGEIAAEISSACFQWLDAPVMRCGSLDTAVPMSNHLEWNFLPRDRFKQMLKQLAAY
ncbi:MAG: dehydrogenase E1 component subunit alpha/beta [Bacteroidia bacterium]|mgnify:FL=1|nr:dehydrogenase E1 component subunit alpha/beta [Bacteroidia bacterium]HMU76970.1 dehydrogenase E1 component subunit alpha/beta [Bacteroidia bacterium]HMW09727.1 dehydrogenase E1 component subunit alpha/beta [Bacteroidia bacterium]HMX96979.1 dehydrogenase E1 component subunit alpha/beta [Bacteroidia bacterium]HMY12525.1 dehydrogenase E1 component subunit alpha/beta [Bacteroidia bacterium]